MSSLSMATFGGGCFWCTEAVFTEVRGVHSVQSGYSGGHDTAPTYDNVCSGRTGHAEVIQILFDATVVDYADLLEIFFATHDPTTPNRQGNDVGPQYRSVIFYHDSEQQRIAEEYIEQLNQSGGRKIVTEVVPFEAFYSAEEYHKNYFELHPYQPYCQFVIQPKVEKFRKKFTSKLAEK